MSIPSPNKPNLHDFHMFSLTFCFCFLSVYSLALFCLSEAVSDIDAPVTIPCAWLLHCAVKTVAMTAVVRFLFLIHAIT